MQALSRGSVRRMLTRKEVSAFRRRIRTSRKGRVSAEKPGQHIESLDPKTRLSTVKKQSARGRVFR